MGDANKMELGGMECDQRTDDGLTDHRHKKGAFVERTAYNEFIIELQQTLSSSNACQWHANAPPNRRLQ